MSNRAIFRLALPPALLALAAVFAYGQIVIGGMPGQRRYPGNNPYPTQQLPTTNFVGMLRSIANNSVGNSSGNPLVLETDDQRLVTISLERRTRYISTSGGNARITDFQPGDRLSIDATEDNYDNFHAVKVTLLRPGTAQERAEASQPVDGSSRSSSNSGIGNSPSSSDDPDRPRLRRAPSAGTDDTPGPVSSTRSISASDDPVARPRTRRAVSSADDTPGAQIIPGDSSSQGSPSSSAPVSPAPAPRISDDSDRPRLIRRNDPQSSSASAAPVMADARPSLHAEDINGATRLPSNPIPDGREPLEAGGVLIQPSGDPVIDQARESAFSFSETLPNYVVKQYTTRFQSYVTRSRSTAWKSLDNITADVVYQDGKESYRNILLNGRPSREAPEKTGSWSSGEFASLLQDVMSPITNADFHPARQTTIVNRPAWRYDFSVAQANSHWHITADDQTTQPSYTGSIWIDKENYRALRIELSARNLPGGFPLDQVESSIDYDYVLIADRKYLLPTHSEALSCARGGVDCSRNVTEFRDYRKFTADTSITFEPTDQTDHK
jgi:hypothetical protein